MSKQEPQLPPKYEPEGSMKTFTGTDIYLTIVSVALTSMIVRTSLMVVLAVHNLTLQDNWIWSLMAVSGLVAGNNCLSKDQTQLYKIRVCNSITGALQTVFVGPFTALAQMARSVSLGFRITRNLFD